MRVVAVAAVMGAAVLAYSVTRVRAQNASTSGPAGAAGTTAAANAPIVVANRISARALALGPAVATTEASQQSFQQAQQLPPIYFIAAQMPNRVMALPSAANTNVNANAASVASAANANLVSIAGNGTAGSLGDGGAGVSAELNLKFDSPYMRSGVAVAADGTIFIADTKNATIRRVASASSSEPGVIRSVAGKWGPAQNVQLVEPMGLALDRAGNLYIADHGANAVIELHDATAATPGKLEVLAHVAHAAGIALTPDGSRLFVTAPETDSVFTFDFLTPSIQQAWGPISPASPVLVQYHPCGTIAKDAQPCPVGIAVDGGGNLFVADSAANKIIRTDAESGSVNTAASGISAPGEIAFDSDGNLFIAEQGRNRIVEIKGLGQPVASVTLTPPPAPVPPAGVPCPIIAPPPGFAFNTNFCAEPLSGITPTSAFTLTNNSNAQITGIAISTIGLAPADFVVSSTSCTTTLNAGASCLINLGFQPKATGPRTATLVVTYTGATSPLPWSVAGTGDDYQIVLASGQLTEISIDAGATGTFMMQLVPDNIFTGTVTFICPGNLPMETTCTFTPPMVNVTTPGTAVPFNVAFQTTSRVPVPVKTGAVAVAGASGTPGGSSNSLGAILALILVVLLGFALLSSTGNPLPVLPKHLIRAACAIALALSVAAILEGCHSGSSSSGGVTGTPAGEYKMTVQATAQAAPRGITVTLDVE